jgi:hypothetical protein
LSMGVTVPCTVAFVGASGRTYQTLTGWPGASVVGSLQALTPPADGGRGAYRTARNFTRIPGISGILLEREVEH